MAQVSVSEVSKNLSHWINQASYGREVIIITSRGRAKAVILGIESFEDLIGLRQYAEQDLMPLDQLREEFRQALMEAGYRTPDEIVDLVREVKREVANERLLPDNS